ncbi:MAG TPA: BTAD domain-containing putative transcriptional regulator [Longimicrobiales bacterium]|nr:BTAD domain-containing putative transcriptional regulator [Longimicrobiales bacterium]
MALMLVRLTTLGAARVHFGDAHFPDLPAQRLRFALLLYLAVERDVAREEVVAMFWPDRDTARGKHALRQMLYELRQVLGEDWVDMRRDRIVVSAAVDALEFESAVENGRLTDALALYGGPFLHGFSLDNRSFEAWADRRRGHLARLHRRLQRDHIAALVAAGQADDALNAARHWVELDPLDDEAAHTLIERLAAAGQRTAALQYYDNYVRQLEAELDVEPLEETQALVASIRNGDAVSPSVGSERHASAPPSGSEVDGPASSVGSVSDASVPVGATTPSQPPSVRVPARAAEGSWEVAGVVADRRSAQMPLRRRPREMWRSASLGRRSVVMAALVALAGITAYLSLGTGMSATVATVAESKHVIAMMPISDLSEDESLRALAESLTDDLTQAISRSHQVGVRSSTAVSELRNRGVSETELGTQLGVSYMVGGRLSQAGDVVRVVIELLDGNGIVLRTQAIERPSSESHNLSQDMAGIAEEFLRTELRLPAHVRFQASGASSEEAFRLVNRARDMQYEVVSMLNAGERPAAHARLVEMDSILALASSLDSEWAEPVVRRGWNLERRVFIAGYGHEDPVLRRKLLERALSFADQAEQLSRDNADVHALRGTLLYHLAQMDGSTPHSLLAGFADAEAELKRATQLDPSNDNAWARLSDLQFAAGRYGESAYSAEQGFSVAGPWAQGFLYQRWRSDFEIGDDLEASGWCGQLWKVKPTLPGLDCLLSLEAWEASPPDPAASRRLLARFLQKSDLRRQPEIETRFNTLLAAIYAQAGQPDSARVILDRLDRDEPGSLWIRAGVEALLGNDAEAVVLLGRYLEVDPRQGPRIASTRPFWDLATRVDLNALVASRSRIAADGRAPSAGVERENARPAGPNH